MSSFWEASEPVTLWEKLSYRQELSLCFTGLRGFSQVFGAQAAFQFFGKDSEAALGLLWMSCLPDSEEESKKKSKRESLALPDGARGAAACVWWSSQPVLIHADILMSVKFHLGFSLLEKKMWLYKDP